MALPTWVDTVAFAGGDADVTADGREAGWTSMRGSSSIPTMGYFVADAGRYSGTLDNRARKYDPLYAAGTHFGDLVPQVGFQKVTTFNAVAYPTFTGVVDSWPQFYPMTGYDQTVDFQVSDCTTVFAQAQLSVSLGVQKSGDRIQAVVDALGWLGPTDIDTGTTLCAPVTGSVSAWSVMQDACAVEFGDLYFAADGTLTFRDRNRIATETRSTVSQASFGDTSGLKYADVTMGSPPIINDVTVTYNGVGQSVNFQDTTSIGTVISSDGSIRGPKSLNVTLPFQTASDARAFARWICQLYSEPITTITSLTIKPERDNTNLFPQVLGRELGDLITVTRTPGIDSGNGKLVASTAITKTVWIRGIQHTYSGRAWTGSTFYLQDAGWATGLAIFDTSTFDGPEVFGL